MEVLSPRDPSTKSVTCDLPLLRYDWIRVVPDVSPCPRTNPKHTNPMAETGRIPKHCTVESVRSLAGQIAVIGEIKRRHPT